MFRSPQDLVVTRLGAGWGRGRGFSKTKEEVAPPYLAGEGDLAVPSYDAPSVSGRLASRHKRRRDCCRSRIQLRHAVDPCELGRQGSNKEKALLVLTLSSRIDLFFLPTWYPLIFVFRGWCRRELVHYLSAVQPWRQCRPTELLWIRQVWFPTIRRV